jgi:hypothetical protein
MYMDSLQVGAAFDLPQVLSEMTATLNRTSSTSIGGVSPSELVAHDQAAVAKMRRATKPHLYWSSADRATFFRLVDRHIIAEPGQYVRVTAASSTFGKLLQRKYSKRELFQVSRVRFPIPASGTVYSMYLLEDSRHDVIAGLFKTSEIIPVANKYSPLNPAFRYHITALRAAPQRGMVMAQYAGTRTHVGTRAFVIYVFCVFLFFNFFYL